MYSIDWLQTALDQLATIWMQADSGLRKSISRATNEIDSRLQLDPLGQSESRPGGRRVLIALPLGTLFRIEGDGKTIAVLRVWLCQKRRK
jgi:hypothetical protein